MNYPNVGSNRTHTEIGTRIMSNLKLPTMTYDNLSKLLGGRSAKTLAYATTAERHANGNIIVRQHGNAIAELSPDTLYIDQCGWDSSTTANRLRKVMADNEVGYYVRIRDFGMRLYNASHTEIDSAFHSASFTKHGDAWALNHSSLS